MARTILLSGIIDSFGDGFQRFGYDRRDFFVGQALSGSDGYGPQKVRRELDAFAVSIFKVCHWQTPGRATGGQPDNAYLRAMLRITITPAAYEAIAATLPSNMGVEQNCAPNGDYFIWLDPKYVDRLRAMRGPGESYSDVILRLAAEA